MHKATVAKETHPKDGFDSTNAGSVMKPWWRNIVLMNTVTQNRAKAPTKSLNEKSILQRIPEEVVMAISTSCTHCQNPGNM